MEQLGRNPRIAGALSAIGAVVTSVIAHLALWFAGEPLFSSWYAGECRLDVGAHCPSPHSLSFSPNG